MHQLTDYEIKNAVRGQWRSILALYGLSYEQLIGKHSPCPICREGKDRFRFDDIDGDGSWICSRCGAGDGFSLLMKLRGMSYPEAKHEVTRQLGKGLTAYAAPPKADKNGEWVRDYLKKIMESATREIINPYLQNRGLTVIPRVWYTRSLKYLAPNGAGSWHPAMLGIVRSADGEPIALHRTYLTPDGRKADVETPKKVTSAVKPLAGGAIRLFPHSDTLGITEGIETACAAMELFGTPTWSAICANGIATFVPPPEVKRLVIFADNDEHGVGQRAAETLQKRLALESDIEVSIRLPSKVGADWLDVLLENREASDRDA